MSDDLEKVLAKRDELLGEVKTLRAKVVELEAANTEAEGRATVAEDKLMGVLLHKPVDDVLSPLLAMPTRRILDEVKAAFSFTLGDDGQVKFTDKDGKPVVIEAATNPREAGFTANDVHRALCEHGGFDDVVRDLGKSGSGAGQSKVVFVKNDSVAPQFGLR